MSNITSLKRLDCSKAAFFQDDASFQDDATNKKFQFDQRFGSCNTNHKIQLHQPYEYRKMYSYKFSYEKPKNKKIQNHQLQPNDLITITMSKTSGLTFPKIVILSEDCYIGVEDNYYSLNFNGNIQYIERQAQKNSNLKIFDAHYLKKSKISYQKQQQQSIEILVVCIETFQKITNSNQTNPNLQQRKQIKQNFIHVHLCQMKIEPHAIILQKAIKLNERHIYYEINSFQKKKKSKNSRCRNSFKSTLLNNGKMNDISALKLLDLPRIHRSSPKNSKKTTIRRGQKCLTTINSLACERQNQMNETYVIKDYALLGEKGDFISSILLPSIFSSKILILAISLKKEPKKLKKQKSQKTLTYKFNLQNKKIYEDCELILIDIQQSNIKDNILGSITSLQNFQIDNIYRKCQIGKFIVKNFIKFVKPDVGNRLIAITKDQVYDLTEHQNNKFQQQVAHTYNLSIQDHIFFKPSQFDSKFNWKKRKSALSLKPLKVRAKLNNFNTKNRYSSPDVAFRLMMQEQNILDSCFNPGSSKLIVLTTFRILYIQQQGIILSENIQDVKAFTILSKKSINQVNSSEQLSQLSDNYLIQNEAISLKTLNNFYDQIIPMQNNLIMRNSKTCDIDILKLQDNRLHFVRHINYLNEIKMDYLKEIKDKIAQQSRIVSRRQLDYQKIEEFWITGFAKSCQHLDYMNSNSIYIQFVKETINDMENSNQKHNFELKVCKLKPLITSQTFDLFEIHFDDAFFLKSKQVMKKQEPRKMFPQMLRAAHHLFTNVIDEISQQPQHLIQKSAALQWSKNQKNIIICSFCKSIPLAILFKDGYLQAWKLPKICKDNMVGVENLFKDQFTCLIKNEERIISISIHPLGIKFLIHTTHNLYFCQFQTFAYVLILTIPIKNKHISLAYFNYDGNYLIFAGQQGFKDKNISVQVIDCFSMIIKKKLQMTSGGKYCPDWIATNKQVKAFYFLGDFAILYCKLWKRSSLVKHYIFYIDCRENNNNIIYSCQLQNQVIIHGIDNKMIICANQKDQIWYIWHEKVLSNQSFFEQMDYINFLQSFKINFKQNQYATAIQMNYDIGFIFIGTNKGNVYQIYYPCLDANLDENQQREYAQAYTYSISSRKIIKLHLSAHLRFLYAACQLGHLYCLQLKQFKNYSQMSSPVYNISAQAAQNNIISFIVKDYFLSSHIPCIKKIIDNLEDKITELNYLVMKCIAEKEIGDKNARTYEKLYQTESSNSAENIKKMNRQYEKLKYNGKIRKRQIEEMMTQIQAQQQIQIQKQKKIYDQQLLEVYAQLSTVYDQKQEIQKQHESDKKIMQSNLKSIQKNYEYQCENIISNMEQRIKQVKDNTICYDTKISNNVLAEENKSELKQITSVYLLQYLSQLSKQQSKREQLIKNNIYLDKNCKNYKKKAVQFQSITKQFILQMGTLKQQSLSKHAKIEQLQQYSTIITKNIEKQTGLQQLITILDQQRQLKTKFQYHTSIDEFNSSKQYKQLVDKQKKETNVTEQLNIAHKKSYQLSEEVKKNKNQIQNLKRNKRVKDHHLFVSKLKIERANQLIESVAQYSLLTGQQNQELLSRYFNELMLLLFNHQYQIIKSQQERKKEIQINKVKQKQHQMIKNSLNSRKYLFKNIKLQEMGIQQSKKLSKGPRYYEQGIILMNSYNQLRKQNKQILVKQAQIREQISRLQKEQENEIQNQKKRRTMSQKSLPKYPSINSIKLRTPFQNYWDKIQSTQSHYSQENQQEQDNKIKNGVSSTVQIRTMLKKVQQKPLKSHFSGSKQQIDIGKMSSHLQATYGTKFKSNVLKSVQKFKLNGKLDDNKIAKFYYLNKNREILKL